MNNLRNKKFEKSSRKIIDFLFLIWKRNIAYLKLFRLINSFVI